MRGGDACVALGGIPDKATATPRLGYPATLLLRSPQIPLKQQIQKRFRELWIIVHMLVKLEVTFDHIFPLFIRYNSTSEVEACSSGRGVTIWLATLSCEKPP